MITKKQAQEIISVLLADGADYAELFMETTFVDSFNNFDNKRFTPSKSESKGTSMRMFYGQEVVFATINAIDFETVLAKAKEMVKGQPVTNFEFKTEHIEERGNDFGDHTPTSIKSFLEKIVDRMKAVEGVSIGTSSIFTSEKIRLIANSEGAFVIKNTVNTGLSYNATSRKGDESESMGGQLSKQLSFNALLEEFAKPENSRDVEYVAKVAVDLLDAPRIESGEMPVILPNGFGAVLFHEACGHPLEASFIATGKSKYAGKVGQKVASDIVTLIDDGTLQNERGTSKYDDEGVLNRERVLIKDGILQGYLIDRYHGNLMGVEPNGAGRRQSYGYNNTSRMSNTYIKPGKSSVEEILKATKKGYYAKRLGGGQVDPFTGQFNFGVSEGYLIEDGKIKHLVKGASLIGNGIDALLKVDMIADDLEIAPGTCGSSSGQIPVTVGQPTLRVSKMTVGGK